MAIITVPYRTREDGVALVRTYSDRGVMIERDGIRYAEAVDPEEYGRTYTETDEPINAEWSVSEEDYKAALRQFGVSI